MATIQLKRDCEATQIPSGNKIKLTAGTSVRITQSLGGSYTVVTEEGWMVRISGDDIDALGMETSKTEKPTVPERSVEEQAWDALRTCYDPEIPVNIVDLGLIYFCQVVPLSEGGYKVEIKMTLTAPGCGMGDILRADVQGKILRIAGVKQADIQLVWEPHWDPSRMSEAAKLQLGML